MVQTILNVLMMTLFILNLCILWHVWGHRLWVIRRVCSELRKINQPSDLFAGYGLIDNLVIKIDSHNSLYMRVENAPEFNAEARRMIQAEILESREHIERVYDDICVGRSVALERMSGTVLQSHLLLGDDDETHESDQGRPVLTTPQSVTSPDATRVLDGP